MDEFDYESCLAGAEARRELLTNLRRSLQELIEENLAAVPHVDRISFRTKDPASFAEKAVKRGDDGERKYSEPFREIEDQIAGRILVFFLADIPIVANSLQQVLGAVEREYKQPAGPSEFGYESLHLVFTIPQHHIPDGWESQVMPTTFELQVRTLFQHAWAEPQHDLGYKGEAGDEIARRLAWVSASAWGADRELDGVAMELATSKLGESSQRVRSGASGTC